MIVYRSPWGVFTVRKCKESGMFCVNQVWSNLLLLRVTVWTRSEKKALKNVFELCCGIKTVERFADGIEKCCENTMPDLFA